MSLKLTCPNPACAKRYALADEAPGRSIRCKGCGQTLVVGDSATLDAPPRGGPREPAPDLAAQSNPAAPAAHAIGRFVVRGRLGAGAFGTVYRAYDPHLDREVALKVPNPGVMTDAKLAERFLREAKAAANLRHPHIVPVFDAGKDGDTYYIASAFVDGRPLADAIPEGGTDFARAARLTRELAEALAYAHEQGTVHRDVKPQNVVLDAHDRVHLMDFGLAARQDEAAKLTNDGAVLGTPSYMAPEQAAGQSGDAQPAADQYAVGVVLYELLTGQVPFNGPLAAVIHNAIHTEPDPPRELRPGVPRDLETICLKALAKRPEERYPDCRALADDLRRWLEGEPIVARRMGLAERAVRWVRGEPKLAGAAATVLVVVLVSLVLVALAALDRDAALNRVRAAEEAAKQYSDSYYGALGTAQQERDEAVAQHKRADTAEQRAGDAEQRARAERQRAANAERATEAERTRTAAERTKAETERTKAEAEQAKAEAERKRADTEWARAEAARHEVGALQAKFVQAADAALRGGNRSLAVELLTAVEPEARGPQWEGVNRLCTEPTDAPGFKIKPDELAAGSFSADESRLVAVGRDKIAHVFDAASGLQVAPLEGHTGTVYAASFSGDGKLIVTGSRDRTARVWDATTGKPVATLEGHTGGLYAVCFSEDGTRAVTGSWDRTAKVWDLKTKKELRTLSGHLHSVYAARFSRDGTLVVTGSADGTARVWDVATGEQRQVLRLPTYPGPVRAVAFSPDGALVATGSGDGVTRLWNTRTGELVRSLERHGQAVTAVAFHPKGTFVVTGGEDRTVRVWSPETGKEVSRPFKEPTRGVTAVAFDAGGTRVVAMAGGLLRWDAQLPGSK